MKTKDDSEPLLRLVGRRFRDTDKRRYGIIVGIKYGMPLMQLAGGRQFLITLDAIDRGWIECEEQKTK